MVTRLDIVINPLRYGIDSWNTVLKQCPTTYDANAWLEYMRYNGCCSANGETQHILHEIAYREKNESVNYSQMDISNGHSIFHTLYPENL